MAQLYYKKVNYSPYRDRIPLQIVRAETELSAEEKAFLNAVEKGDYATVKQALQEAEIYYNVNINCMDPLGRSALLIAIENENLEIMELLLNHSVYVGDALLYAIRKEVVGAVELLLSYRRPSGEKQKPYNGNPLLSKIAPVISRGILELPCMAHTEFYSFAFSLLIFADIYSMLRLPRKHSGKESACQCRRCKIHGFDPCREGPEFSPHLLFPEGQEAFKLECCGTDADGSRNLHISLSFIHVTTFHP
ncbi:hypothetical protein FD755_024871 [Muntiacus reevesi]|uniref:Uncharacterized protein n=1 Tax=Muntiacus reevesi TaxID=9886 RepID=A0A5N3UT74_MUNRE|nr:hypothetical protein FD755_024871 [Muntiacus reevesi]